MNDLTSNFVQSITLLLRKRWVCIPFLHLQALVARLYTKCAFRLLLIHKSNFQFLVLGFKQMHVSFGCAVGCAKFDHIPTFFEWDFETSISLTLS